MGSIGMETVDPHALLQIYTDSALIVLGEMGLIGAVLAGLALIPALFIGQTVTLPTAQKSKTETDS
jgi:hypothetical protein